MITGQALLILIALVALPAFSKLLQFLMVMLARLLAAAMTLGITMLVLAFIATHGKWI